MTDGEISRAAARRSAEDAFRSGLFCAEAVVRALAQVQGVESDVLPRIATAFCSGVARTGGPCGALSGAVMAVGLAFGRRQAGESVEPSYRAAQQVVSAFEREFGATRCPDLLGCDLGTPEGQRRFREQKLHEKCLRYTGVAAEIAAGVIHQRL